MKISKTLIKSFSLALIASFFIACDDGIDGINGTNGTDGIDGDNGQDGSDGENISVGNFNFSNTRALATMSAGFSNVKISSLISTGDILPSSTGGEFQIGGSADGAGAVINSDGNIALFSNFEDHYSVGRIILNPETLEPIQGDYMLNSSVDDYARQCSGTMWEAAIHGGSEDFFISSSETHNFTSKRIDIEETPNPSNSSDNLIALGQFQWENNVPLPKDAYSGSTVIIGGDDDSSDSQGQIAMYYSNAGDADLSGGKIYVLKRTATTVVETEEDLDFGVEYDVEFVEIPNGAALTKNEMEDASVAANSLQFMRVEDLDYGKGSVEANRAIYFAVTGRGPDRGTYNDWGTGYKLILDAANPLIGKLTQIVSGNTDTNNMDGNMPLLQSPDNICVTDNYIYWQEDPNSFNRMHQAFIWQTNLNGENATPVLQIDYDPLLDALGNSELDSDGFNGEFGALFDITDKVSGAQASSVFALCLQPHYWESSDYQGIDGHFLTPVDTDGDGNPNGREDDQGSQIIILEGLPR